MSNPGGIKAVYYMADWNRQISVNVPFLSNPGGVV